MAKYNIQYKYDKDLPSLQLESLFKSVHWAWEANNPLLVAQALMLSTRVVTAWDGDKLVGLVRCLDDGIWSANIDCVVVHADYQRKGIGTHMMSLLLGQLTKIECISVAPNDSDTAPFYEKNGFTFINGGGLLQIYREDTQ